MCDPATIAIATFALTAGSAVMQQQQAEAAADAQEAQYEQNRVNSLAAMRDSYQQTQLRQQQEEAASAQQARERRMQEREEKATSRVAAAEGGITGFSVDSILRDISTMADTDVQTINTNKDNQLAQLSGELSGIRNTNISRISSVSRGQAPSRWGTALQIGGAGLSSYSGYKTTTAK